MAAFAGAASLLVGDPWRAKLSVIAALAGLLALAGWRFGSRAQPAPLPEPADSLPALVLGADALADAQARVVRAAGDAGDFERALHGVAAALRGELGARLYRVFEVDHSGAQPLAAEMFAAQPGFRARARVLLPTESALAQALGGAAVADAGDALALAVKAEGVVVALLELAEIGLGIEAATRARLLETARAALEAAATRSVPPPIRRAVPA